MARAQHQNPCRRTCRSLFLASYVGFDFELADSAKLSPTRLLKLETKELEKISEDTDKLF